MTKKANKAKKAKKCTGKCVRPCTKGEERAIVSDLPLKDVLSDILKDGQEKIRAFSDAAMKAGELLKFLLVQVKDAKQSYDNVERMLKDGNGVSGVKIDMGGPDIKVEKMADVKAPEKPSKPATFLFEKMVECSKYDFSGHKVEYCRVPESDKDDGLAFKVCISKESKEHGMTSVKVHGFVVYAYLDSKRSVDEFDAIVGAFWTDLPLKRKLQCKGDERKCKHPFKEQGKAGKCPVAKKAGKEERPQPPTIDAIKRSLLFESKYAIPVKRFKVVADHVDTKSGKWVYELRFFQKDYTKSPIKTQSYETVPFRIRMKGDTWTKAGKRFDRAVENLRFNTFGKKA